MKRRAIAGVVGPLLVGIVAALVMVYGIDHWTPVSPEQQRSSHSVTPGGHR